MNKEIILQQKNERDYLLSKKYFQRNVEIDLSSYLKSDLIKLITGPRRAGKSIFALQLLKNENFAYLNFDDESLCQYFDEDKILLTLNEVYPNYKYLLLDEIQNINNWELWVNKLHRRGHNLVITGSNAKLLSRELASSLTGRFLQIEIFPFSFTEFLGYNKLENLDFANLDSYQKQSIFLYLNDYFLNGGYPETFAIREITKNYISTLFDSILLKDISKRFNVRQNNQLYNLASYLLSNFCNLFSFNQLKEQLQLQSVVTTQKFCNYLTEPYLFFYLTPFSSKIKQQQRAQKKVYVIDNSFTMQSFQVSSNYGRLLENLVFVELLRRKFAPEFWLFYYQTKNKKEVDFVCKKGIQIKQLIQVAYNISDVKTLKREISALIDSSNELNCKNLTIITWEEERVVLENDLVVNIIPIWKWLLENDSSIF
jgi:predicted AAA+ superfamily ATPase